MSNEWGPLAGLIGEWQGEGGVDVSHSHARGAVHTTPYFEKVTMKPFGPVQNGAQTLYGLDYKTAMWRDNEENPFHTEVGYWLWDAATGEVLRCFAVPRGITVLAGGSTTADAKSFEMRAEVGGVNYTIGENRYLAERASSVSYVVSITLNDNDTWSYDETTMLAMAEYPELLAHRDFNTLHRTD
ncbi:MAG: heme-binding beta-barrel domain-containing protein [Actinomycetota bacterium]